MNRQRKLSALLAFLFIASATIAAEAQRPSSARANLAELERLMLGLPATSSYMHPGWQIELKPVPGLVRMHCPILKPEQGLVVGRVMRNSPWTMIYDLRYGDILMTVGGYDVMGLSTLPATPGAELVVLRAGEEVALSPRKDAAIDPMRWRRRGLQAGLSTHAGNSGVSASSFASGNESVSISQNGQQLSVKMSLPDLHDGPIVFHGTREQVLEQVKNSKLAPAAKQRVIREIR